MSRAFAALGLFLAYYVYSRTSNTELASGVFYFFLMEFLQFFQYFWIDDCNSRVNQVLTLLGYAHICGQPYFTHVINCALTKNPNLRNHEYKIVKRYRHKRLRRKPRLSCPSRCMTLRIPIERSSCAAATTSKWCQQ